MTRLLTTGRPGGRPIAFTAVGLATWIAIGTISPAFAAAPDPVLGGAFGQNQALNYRWGAGGTPPAAIQTAVNAAAAASNATRRSNAPVFGYSTGGANTVYYGTAVPCGVNGLACFRRDTSSGFGIWLRENGHVYDWGTLRWCEASGAPNGCYDAQNITLDELGHVLGLDHHVNLANDSDYGDAVVQTYSRAKPAAYYNAHAFGRCDVATLQQVYDVQTSSTPYSTCLDVPTKLSMSATKTAVVAGSMVTFSASLLSAGTGRLLNNAISGRTVVLQQHAASGWVDVLTFGSGASSGSYIVQLTMWATTELRALFRKPSGEGLRTSSSASIVVTVTAACTVGPCPQSVQVPAQ